MEVKRHYDSMADRQAIVAECEGQGLRMLHDNFDPDWQEGDEPHGILIFTDEPSPSLSPEPVRDPLAEIDELKAKIADYDDLKARIEKLEEKRL